jgi:hypothetical protein
LISITRKTETAAIMASGGRGASAQVSSILKARTMMIAGRNSEAYCAAGRRRKDAIREGHPDATTVVGIRDLPSMRFYMPNPSGTLKDPV